MIGRYVDVIFKRFFRPTADLGRPSIRCGAASPDRPFMRSAAFSWLKRRSADKVDLFIDTTNGRFAEILIGIGALPRLSALRIVFE